jgi:hypothetical protein
MQFDLDAARRRAAEKLATDWDLTLVVNGEGRKVGPMAVGELYALQRRGAMNLDEQRALLVPLLPAEANVNGWDEDLCGDVLAAVIAYLAAFVQKKQRAIAGDVAAAAVAAPAK